MAYSSLVKGITSTDNKCGSHKDIIADQN